MKRLTLILLVLLAALGTGRAQGISVQCEEFTTRQYSKDFIDVGYTAGEQVTISAYVNGVRKPIGASKGVKPGVKKFRISGLPEKEYEACVIKLDFKDAAGKLVYTREFTLRYKDPRSDLHLLSIGVCGNRELSYPTLDYPRTDAKTVYSFFNMYASAYYTSKGFRVLCDPDETTTSNICLKLDQMANDVREGDVFMLYLSGHGEEKGGIYCFITSDTRKQALSKTALSGPVLLGYLHRMVAKKARVFVFVDTCHAQALYEGNPSLDGIVFFASCGSGEVSRDSVYAQALVQALSGKDGNSQIGNGYVTVGSLQDFLYAAVRRATGFSQNPACSHPGVDESFVIFKAPSAPQEFEVTSPAYPSAPAKAAPVTSANATEAYKKAMQLRQAGKHTEAFPYMLSAAKGGCKDAYFPLADMYHRGQGVTKDRNEAESWYKKAAENGNTEAVKILRSHF